MSEIDPGDSEETGKKNLIGPLEYAVFTNYFASEIGGVKSHGGQSMPSM